MLSLKDTGSVESASRSITLYPLLLHLSFFEISSQYIPSSADRLLTAVTGKLRSILFQQGAERIVMTFFI